MSKSPSLRTPLSKARGLGSAKTGTHHWWLQRVTALALIPLSIWFVTSLVGALIGHSRADIALWIGQPLVSFALLLLLVAMFWHIKLGVQVIIEDYVHHEGRKIALLMLKDTLVVLCAIASIAAVAKLHFIGI